MFVCACVCVHVKYVCVWIDHTLTMVGSLADVAVSVALYSPAAEYDLENMSVALLAVGGVPSP